jgi:hypothetical protein
LDEREELPAITHSLISGQHEGHLQGASGVRHSRVQLDCYAATREQADELADVVRPLLVGHRGPMGDLFINGITIERSSDGADAPEGGGGNWRYIRTLEFLISHEETT